MNHLKKLYLTFKFHIALNKFTLKRHTAKSNMPMCYIFLAADYGNLGDVAITFAQKKLLTQLLPDYKITEVYAANTLTLLPQIKKNIKPNDIITIVGGGNMGDMYGDIELLRLIIVNHFQKNKVILFPQTIFYSDSKEAKWLKNLSKNIYCSHNNLIMLAREMVSYNTMKALYPSVNIRLVPDIVMTLNQINRTIKREQKVTYCLRQDNEQADHKLTLQKIRQQIANIGFQEEFYDTHIGSGRFTEEEKYNHLEKIWTQFSTSNIVITDRLHGMIFSYITGTPAIVLPNSNFKVQACFNWIKDCGYITLITNQDFDINTIIKSTPTITNIDNNFINYFKDLI